MIAIVCRSAYLASSMSAMLSEKQALWLGPDDTHPDLGITLSNALEKNQVSVVFYEPSFFVDPAPFRTVSPSTRFVVLTAPGEETTGNEALSYGAAAMVTKPVEEKAVNGVFQLVTI